MSDTCANGCDDDRHDVADEDGGGGDSRDAVDEDGWKVDGTIDLKEKKSAACRLQASSGVATALPQCADEVIRAHRLC